MKKVIIVDDDKIIAEMMQEKINENPEFKCNEIYHSGEEIMELELDADYVLLDIVMPGISGLDTIPKILKKNPEMHIIMSTIKDDSETIFESLKLGALGYIDKQSFDMNFTEVFDSIEKGGAYMTPKIARKIVYYFQKPKGILEKLTSRENDIVNGILEGLSYKLISDKYGISIDTVRMNIKNIYRKLKINSKGELFYMMTNKK